MVTYFGIIGFLKFNSRVPYCSKDMTPQSIFGRQISNKDITILVKMAEQDEQRSDSDADFS